MTQGESLGKDRSQTVGSLVVLVVTYLALGIAFQRSVPLFEAPDEPSHIEYAAFLSREHRLPRYGPTPDVPGEAMQPPLYYMLAAPLFRMVDVGALRVSEELHRLNLSMYRVDEAAIASNTRVVFADGRSAHVFATDPRLDVLKHLRWLSLLFGLLSVWLTYAATLRALGDRSLAVLAATFVGLNPQFLFVSGYVSNDTAAVAVSAAGFWLAAGGVRDGRSGRSRYLGTALLCCVGLWTKTSTLPGLFVLALAVFLTDRRPSADRLKDVALAVGLLLAVAGPYLIWNIATYGDPLGVGAMWQVAKPFEGPERFGGAWSYLTGSYWTWTLESYWACFGWMQLFAPQPLYAVFALIVAIGVAGFVLSWLPRRRTTTDGTGSSRAEALPWPAHLRSYLVASIALTFAAHIWINVHEIMWQGRHLFVAAPQFGCLLACGHARWSSGDSARSTTSGTFGMMALMGALALYCLIAVVIPAYPETS